MSLCKPRRGSVPDRMCVVEVEVRRGLVRKPLFARVLSVWPREAAPAQYAAERWRDGEMAVDLLHF